MKHLVKKYLPKKVTGRLKWLYSLFRITLARRYGVFDYSPQHTNKRTRILFYDIDGLFYAGTQKNLQILAKYLNKDKYEVYYMYSSKHHSERKSYLEREGVTLIDFEYSERENSFPYLVKGMKPHIFDVIKEHKIDLLIVAGSGYPEFPFVNITKLPIIFINIFGSVNIQKNIAKQVCISHLVASSIKDSVPKSRIDVMYVPSDGPDREAANRGKVLRSKLGFSESDIVFGRIGRGDDNIFDPIGIRAFQMIVKKYSQAHYLIVSPSPELEKIVSEGQIPNVHFMDPISDEKDIWAFHNAIDVLAHFRKDGETCGLNIAESMLCGKPIISHRSVVWNAHLEYLEDSFARVAQIDDSEAYARFMEEYIVLKREGQLVELGERAKKKASKIFLINNTINKFEEYVDQAVS